MNFPPSHSRVPRRMLAAALAVPTVAVALCVSPLIASASAQSPAESPGPSASTSSTSVDLTPRSIKPNPDDDPHATVTSLTAEPSTGLHDGDPVRVRATFDPPGSAYAIYLCSQSDPTGNSTPTNICMQLAEDVKAGDNKNIDIVVKVPAVMPYTPGADCRRQEACWLSVKPDGFSNQMETPLHFAPVDASTPPVKAKPRYTG
jgi:hypothetical protein